MVIQTTFPSPPANHHTATNTHTHTHPKIPTPLGLAAYAPLNLCITIISMQPFTTRPADRSTLPPPLSFSRRSVLATDTETATTTTTPITLKPGEGCRSTHHNDPQRHRSGGKRASPEARGVAHSCPRVHEGFPFGGAHHRCGFHARHRAGGSGAGVPGGRRRKQGQAEHL